VPARNPYPTAAPFLPDKLSMTALREAVQGCRGCPLYANATQAVFGEGKLKASVMLVGEQPGDREDVEGRPFVGPAGALLDKALDEAGIDRTATYLTNAVKHFKWTPKGKRRIHQKPNAAEIEACRPWLDAEIGAVRPAIVVALGATAAQALLGRDFRVTRHRGEFFDQPDRATITATVHPSSILRARDDESRHREMAAFVDDLRTVAKKLAEVAAG
jgi:DNA polymerase